MLKSGKVGLYIHSSLGELVQADEADLYWFSCCSNVVADKIDMLGAGDDQEG